MVFMACCLQIHMKFTGSFCLPLFPLEVLRSHISWRHFYVLSTVMRMMKEFTMGWISLSLFERSRFAALYETGQLSRPSGNCPWTGSCSACWTVTIGGSSADAVLDEFQNHRLRSVLCGVLLSLPVWLDMTLPIVLAVRSRLMVVLGDYWGSKYQVIQK
ncbi:hypothetical protein BT93_L4376 [Corymbia citriodora subsp. variegata]|uniref:Uncharacterized protein n=1 Tax=Corymbia citriodora subsp. variegata TaxID=360336 RepID=A0A8T0CG17_CORYI|nr:hypothetical protein BT93_L4376 [Corymbia citriodora subsp. variegata]